MNELCEFIRVDLVRATLRTTRRAAVALAVAMVMHIGGVLRFQANNGQLIAGTVTSVSLSDEKALELSSDDALEDSSDLSVMKLGDHRFAHRSQVDQVVFAPDGKWIASICRIPKIEIWNASSGERFQTLVADESDQHGVESIAVSPDGKWLIGGQRDGWINVWSTANWKLASRSKSHDASVSVITFSSDSTQFATGTEKGTVQLCTVAAPAIVKHRWQVDKKPAPLGDFVSGSTGVAAIAFSRDGKQLITGTGGDAKINVIDIATSEILRTIEHAHPVSSMNPALSSLHILSENQVLTVGSRSIRRSELPPGKSFSALNVQITELKVWNFETGELVRDITADRFDIGFGHAAVTSDGQTAVLGCWDQLVFFDLAEAVELRTISLPGWWGKTPTIATNRVAVGMDQRISLWDLTTGRPVLASPERNLSAIQDCVWSPDGGSVTMLDNDGIINTWDSATGKLQVQRSFGKGGHGSALGLSGDGQSIAAGGLAVDSTGRNFGMLQVWATDGDMSWQSHLNARARDCCVSADGTHVAVAASNGSIGDTRLQLFERKGRGINSLCEFPDESKPGLWQPEEMTFTADGESVWITDGNSEIIRWDFREKKEGRRFIVDWRLIIPGHEKERFAQIWDAVFCMENQTVVISALDHIMVWDLTTGQLKLDMPVPGIAKGFTTLALSHNGRYVAAAEVNYAGAPGSDTIRVFDLSERKEILAVTPLDNRATALSFSPDSNRLLAGYSDGTGEIWNFATKKPVVETDLNI